MKMTYALRRAWLRLFCVLTVLLTLASGAFAAQRPGVQVTVPSVIYMQDRAFTLGEAARIEGPVQARAALSSLILSTSGGILTRDEVLQAIKASGQDGISVELRMPVRVRVETPGPEGNGTETPGYNTPTPSDTSLSSMVKSLSAWDGEVEVTAVGSIPQGRLVEPASTVPGTPAATLRFQDDRGRVRSLSVRMAWKQNVLVAARTIQRNVPITARDLMTRSVKLSRPGVYAVDPAEAVGHVSRKPIKQGEPILREFLAGPSQVKKGRKVTIVARYGGLTATAEGVLLEDGSPGDLVKVRRSDNKKAVVKGYIVDENTVEVKVQ